MSSPAGGDRKLYVSLKLGVTFVAGADFAAERTAWPETQSGLRLPMPSTWSG